MRHDTMHARCQQLLHGIKVPQPFCLDAFAAAVAAAHGRPLRILPLPDLDGTDGLSGAWAATDTTDYILIDAFADGWHRDLIGLHEIGHILAGHETAGRSADEQEAELTAWLILAELQGGPPRDSDLISLRALRGMRDELVAAVPGVAAGSWADEVAGPGGHSRIRLIRRSAEIRDAALALRGYVPPGTVASGRRLLSAYGLAGVALDAASEACWLNLATQAARAGSAASEPAHLLPGRSTLRAEVSWLREVAGAMRSPSVLAVSAHFAAPPSRAPRLHLRVPSGFGEVAKVALAGRSHSY